MSLKRREAWEGFAALLLDPLAAAVRRGLTTALMNSLQGATLLRGI